MAGDPVPLRLTRTLRECQRRRRDLVQFIMLLGPPKDSLFIVYIYYFSNFYAEGFYPEGLPACAARDCPLPDTLCLSVFTGVSLFVQFDQPNRCQVYSAQCSIATCHVGARATLLNTHDAVSKCRVSGHECDVGTCLHTKYRYVCVCGSALCDFVVCRLL
jgi:hypothetical protein